MTVSAREDNFNGVVSISPEDSLHFLDFLPEVRQRTGLVDSTPIQLSTFFSLEIEIVEEGLGAGIRA
jgi:hypothetical protein